MFWMTGDHLDQVAKQGDALGPFFLRDPLLGLVAFELEYGLSCLLRRQRRNFLWIGICVHHEHYESPIHSVQVNQ